MDEVQQRREDAWKAMKRMHDEANGVQFIEAAQGWCAPSDPGTVHRILNAHGEVCLEWTS